PKELNLQLEEIRKKGFAFDQEEVDEGTSAVGAPILDYGGNPIAAIVVAGPSQRIAWPGDSLIVSALKETAEKISKRFFNKSQY
ncbi:MAG: IclR family transcriptional regulator, partial [Deltaproteobacteria bacterium]|nr:IclR family transcriptional regulator [Deltaproteobacteria bacterium]